MVIAVLTAKMKNKNMIFDVEQVLAQKIIPK